LHLLFDVEEFIIHIVNEVVGWRWKWRLGLSTIQ